MSMISHSRRPNEAIPTSSMADIAFLLLVFFLVTTVFPKDRGLALVLPDDGVTTPVDRTNLLVLTVTGDGAVEVLPGGAERSFRIEVARLGSVWRERVTARPGLIAAVRTRPDAPYGALVDVLDALRGAGARRISLQVDDR
jgi:biopolymer transport protein ExbD